MNKLRNGAILMAVILLLALAHRPAEAGVNVGIHIDLPYFFLHSPPHLVPIPGTYAYYVADIDLDIIFYDGRWYRPWGDRWYWARGYNGPWYLAGPRFVPAPLLRLPRDYRRGTVYMRIPHYDLDRNWRRWNRERWWEHRYDWWRKAREEHRHDHYRHDRRHDRQDSRYEHRDDRRDSRRDRMDDMRDDRRDRRDDRRGDRMEHRDDRRDDRRDSRRDRRDDRRGDRGR